MAKQYTGIGVLAVLAALAACSSSATTAGDCTTLPSCCAQLTVAADKAACDEAVSAGDPTTCGDVQSEFASSTADHCTVATATGGGSGCAGLTACCATLSATQQTICNDYVTASAGSDSTCSTFLAEYPSCMTVSTGGTGCAGLSTCCASLPTAEQAGCDDIVSVGNATTCSAELTSLQSGGMCGTGSGSGTGGTGCAGLSACCGSLPSTEQVGCQDIVTAGDATTCSAELSAYQTDGMCGTGSGSGTGTGGTGCSALSSCCGTLPSTEQAGCQDIVTAGDATTCSAELTAYQDQGNCGGTGTGSGSSSTGSGSGSGGTGCSGLSACCSQLSSTYQTSCDTIVSEGNDATCSEELSVYQTDGLCS